MSAGGVVVRDRDVIVIVPVRRGADGKRVLALPKGHMDGDESLAQAAQREVREETGAKAELVERLGEVRYSYERGGRRVSKKVTFYLFRYQEGDLSEHDHEIADARWMPLEEAARSLTYDGEREMVARALRRLGPDR